MGKYSKKYGYGGTSYGSNLYTPYSLNEQVQYNFQKVNEAQKNATDAYNQNQQKITTDYRNSITKINEDYKKRKKNESYFKNTFKAISNYKGKGEKFTQGQQFNQYMTDKLGVGVTAPGQQQFKPGEWLNDNLNPFAKGNILNRTPGQNLNPADFVSESDYLRAVETANLQDEFGTNAYLGGDLEGYEIVNDQIVPVDAGAYDGTITGQSGTYSADDHSTVYDPQSGTNTIVDSSGAVVDNVISGTVQQSLGQKTIEEGTKKGVVEVGANVGATHFNAAGDLIQTSTGKVLEKAKETVIKKSGEEVIKTSGTEVIKKSGDEVTTEVVKKGAEGTAKGGEALVQGGLWTVPVDMGLHYISDDGDPSTYTAGEVGTDVASLALDIVTQDWIGAAFQLYDMGSQWFTRNKTRREQKKAEAKRTKDIADSWMDYEEDLHASSRYRGTERGMKGRRSNTAQLGGFSYNIQ